MKTAIFITGLLVALALVSVPYYVYGTVRDVQVVVNDKQIFTSGNKEHVDSKYLVFTDQGVFENEDAWFYLKFDSSDYQNKLAVGSRYKIKVYGYRIPILSWYPNIVKVKAL